MLRILEVTSPPMPPVTFHHADVKPVKTPPKAGLKQFIQALFTAEGKSLSSISYIFCSDEYLLQINKDFLQHDYYTDIITFDFSGNEGIVGEVYVSVDRVKENAVDHKVLFEQELLRVLFHGALHLCGYGDKKKREFTIMRNKEDEYLRLFEKQ